jgi:hypothetical protein
MRGITVKALRRHLVFSCAMFAAVLRVCTAELSILADPVKCGESTIAFTTTRDTIPWATHFSLPRST